MRVKGSSIGLRHPEGFLADGDALVEAPQIGEAPAEERAGELGGRAGFAESLRRPRARERAHDLLKELDGVRGAALAESQDTEEERRHHLEAPIARRCAQGERPPGARDRVVLPAFLSPVVDREVGESPSKPPIVADGAGEPLGRVHVVERWPAPRPAAAASA